MSGVKRAVRLRALQVMGRLLARRAADPAGDPRRVGRGSRILLIRPDHLGDVLLATPVARVLSAALPAAQIDWLVGPWSAEMVRRAGGPAGVQTLDFPGFTRGPKRSPLTPYRLLFQEAARLRAQRYDAALVLRPDHWWGAFLAAAAGIPRRFGYAAPECQPFLTDALPPPAGHVVEANQQLARAVAAALGGQPTAETIAPAFPCDLSLPSRRSADESRPLVAVHPGSGAALKSWPVANWAAVVQALQETYRAEIIMTGGPGERGLVRQIADLVTPRPQTVAGETSLDALASLFAWSDLVVGGDSGPLHLAAAVGTPTVRLYGPTDVREFGPWPPDGPHVALAAGLPCQPCRNLTAPPCDATETPACLRAITPEAVVAVAGEFLALRALLAGQVARQGGGSARADRD